MADTINNNLIKGTSVIGLKILTLKTGEKIEDIDDVLLDSGNKKVLGFLVSSGGLFSEAKVIPLESIKSIGKDAVIVEDSDVLKKVSELDSTFSKIAKGNNYLTKTKVVTETGTELGEVSDIYFNLASGEVEELEVSQGSLKNIQSGKKRVRTTDITTFGKDALIVKTYTEDLVADQGKDQGLKGIVRDVKDSAQETIEKSKNKTIPEKADGLNEKLTEAGHKIKNKAEDIKDTLAQKYDGSKEKMKEESKKEAVGKYVTKNILDSSDTPLAVRGDMVTNELINRAEDEGLLDQVLDNISNEPLS